MSVHCSDIITGILAIHFSIYLVKMVGHECKCKERMHFTLLIIEFPLSLVLRIVHLLLLTCLLLLITINNDDIMCVGVKLY